MAAFASEQANLQPRRSASSAPTVADRLRALRRAQRQPAQRARLRARRSCPASSETPADDRRRHSRGSPRCAPLVSQAELGGLVDDLVPGDRRRSPRSTDARHRPASPRATCFAKCMKDVDPADRRQVDGHTTPRAARRSRRARRTTRSSGTRWSASPARARTSTATAVVRPHPERRRRPTPVTIDAAATSATTASCSATRSASRSARGRQWTDGKKPAYKPDEACYKQQIPDFAATPTGPSDARASDAHEARDQASTSGTSSRSSCSR